MIFILLSAVGLCCLTSVIADPCRDYVTLSNEKRSALYVSPPTERNICDNEISETTWYRFQVLPPSRLHDRCVAGLHCGTDEPIWVEGDHPTDDDPGPKQVKVCSPRVGDCCGGWSSTISVKFCPAVVPADEGGYYVYRLKRVPRCDMGYCAGDTVVCPQESTWNPIREMCTAKYPKIATPVLEGPLTVKKKLRLQNDKEYDDFCFVCAIDWTGPEADVKKKGEQFEVVFTFDGQEADTIPVRIVDGADLRVRLWSKELLGQMGKTVGCKVRTYWKELKKFRSEFLVSERTYFVGIRYSITNTEGSFTSPRIEIDERDPPLTIYFKSTVPISCPEIDQQTSCKVTITIADISVNDGLGVSGCSIVFSGLEADNEPKIQKIKALPTPGIHQRTSVIRFQAIAVNPAFFWHDYKIPDIPIFIKDSSKTGICSSTGDPHIYTFDKRYYHAYMAGDYLFAKSTSSRHFEVHVRHHKCWAVACNCAVAVREGNNVLGINACQAPHYTPTLFTYLADKNVPGATITNNGNVYVITMPSGAYVKMVWGGIGSSIYLYLNSEDYGKLYGLCGTFNDDAGDDTIPSGTTQSDVRDIPVTFTESYRLSNEESFINGQVHAIECLKIDDQVPNICSCKKKQAVACAAPDDKTKTFGTKFTEHCDKPNPNRRLRRAAGSNETSPEEDDDRDNPEDREPEEEFVVLTEEDLPLPQVDMNHGRNVTFRWPTPGGIDEAEANRRCRSKMETSPVFQDCRDQISQRIDSLVTNCVTDLQVSDNVEESVSYIVSDFQTKCVQKLESSVVKNDGEVSSSPSSIEVLLAKVVANICPGQCNGNGTCNNGTCICNDGFAGQDCSVKARDPPTLIAFRKHSLCDSRTSVCSKTPIFASNMFQSDKLSCRIIAAGHPRQFAFGGSVMSTREVMCGLPPVHRFTSQAGAKADNPEDEVEPAPFYRWDIALTNDGSLYSNSLRLTVYDSKCQECREDGTCTQKEETCIIGGRCFLSVETSVDNQCEKCVPSESRERWSKDKSEACLKVSSASGISNSLKVLTAAIAFCYLLY